MIEERDFLVEALARHIGDGACRHHEAVVRATEEILPCDGIEHDAAVGGDNVESHVGLVLADAV